MRICRFLLGLALSVPLIGFAEAAPQPRFVPKPTPAELKPTLDGLRAAPKTGDILDCTGEVIISTEFAKYSEIRFHNGCRILFNVSPGTATVELWGDVWRFPDSISSTFAIGYVPISVANGVGGATPQDVGRPNWTTTDPSGNDPGENGGTGYQGGQGGPGSAAPNNPKNIILVVKEGVFDAHRKLPPEDIANLKMTIDASGIGGGQGGKGGAGGIGGGGHGGKRARYTGGGHPCAGGGGHGGEGGDRCPGEPREPTCVPGTGGKGGNGGAGGVGGPGGVGGAGGNASNVDLYGPAEPLKGMLKWAIRVSGGKGGPGGNAGDPGPGGPAGQGPECGKGNGSPGPQPGRGTAAGSGLDGAFGNVLIFPGGL